MESTTDSSVGYSTTNTVTTNLLSPLRCRHQSQFRWVEATPLKNRKSRSIYMYRNNVERAAVIGEFRGCQAAASVDLTVFRTALKTSVTPMEVSGAT